MASGDIVLDATPTLVISTLSQQDNTAEPYKGYVVHLVKGFGTDTYVDVTIKFRNGSTLSPSPFDVTKSYELIFKEV